MNKCSNLIILNKNNQILLTKRATKTEYGKWSIPGGSCEIDENPDETLEREILEELNCKITWNKFFDIYEYILKKDFKVYAHYFYGEIDYDKLELNYELSEWKWFELSEIIELDLAFNQNEVLRDFIEYMKHRN